MALDGPEEPEPGVSEHESDSEASSHFSVRMKNEKSGKPPTKKARKDGSTAAGKDDQDKSQKLLARADTILQNLNMVTPLGLYMGKVKDADNRVSKAMDIMTKLESSGSSSARTKSLVSDLQTASNTVSTNTVVIGALRAAANAANAQDRRSALEDFPQSHLDTFAALPADCINSVLADLGRKLIEDCQFGNITKLFYFQI